MTVTTLPDAGLRCQLIERPPLDVRALRRFAMQKTRDWAGEGACARWDEVVLPGGPMIAMLAVDADGPVPAVASTPLLGALSGALPADGLHARAAGEDLGLLAVRDGVVVFVRHVAGAATGVSSVVDDTVGFLRERQWWVEGESLPVHWARGGATQRHRWRGACLYGAEAMVAQGAVDWAKGLVAMAVLLIAIGLGVSLGAYCHPLASTPAAGSSLPAAPEELAVLAERRAAVAADATLPLAALRPLLSSIADAVSDVPPLRWQTLAIAPDGGIEGIFDAPGHRFDPVQWSRLERRLATSLDRHTAPLHWRGFGEEAVAAGRAHDSVRWHFRTDGASGG